MKDGVLLDGLAFPEAPRWRGDRLWFTDQHAREVSTVDPSGRVEIVVSDIDDRPGGLGFLPDGTPLVVAMTERKIYRVVGGQLEPHADLSGLASFHCNDMLVDRAGRAYVGNFGYDVEAGARKTAAELILVETNGVGRVLSRDLVFPNGTAITADGKTLVVAETFASRLSAFDVGADGSLSNHRIHARLDGTHPDGLCLDAEGAVWVACPKQQRLFRVERGAIVASIAPRTPPYACMLGGAERRTLFALCAATHMPEEAARLRSGCIEVFDVDVPGAGLP